MGNAMCMHTHIQIPYLVSMVYLRIAIQNFSSMAYVCFDKESSVRVPESQCLVTAAGKTIFPTLCKWTEGEWEGVGGSG